MGTTVQPTSIFLLLYSIKNVATNISSIVLDNLISSAHILLKMLEKNIISKVLCPPIISSAFHFLRWTSANCRTYTYVLQHFLYCFLLFRYYFFFVGHR